MDRCDSIDPELGNLLRLFTNVRCKMSDEYEGEELDIELIAAMARSWVNENFILEEGQEEKVWIHALCSSELAGQSIH